MTPSFRHVGGKARLRVWLTDHFPSEGSFYCEPFAGKGNVFFLAANLLKFDWWELSDIDVGFLCALRCAALDDLPKEVTKQSFRYWKTRNDPVARLLEPRVTFAGKGYAAGFSGTSGTHVGYDQSRYRETCERARQLLNDHKVMVKERDWRETLSLVDRSCFVYLDPPYYGTDAPYPNIDHAELIEHLNVADFDWALSGYRNDLYDARLEFKCRFEYERNSEIKGSNSGKREPVIETLWTNYEL